MDFEDFHRRLCLKIHVYNENRMFDQLSDQEIEQEQEISQDKHLDKKFDKSIWKPNRVYQSLEIFQRSFNLGLLNSKIKPVH